VDISLARQLTSFVGAFLILVAWAGHQLKWIDARSAGYKVLNAIGSTILAYIAFHPFQIGFVVLEVVWTVISLYALLRTEDRMRFLRFSLSVLINEGKSASHR